MAGLGALRIDRCGSYAFVTGWEVAVLRSSAAAAQREALASAHASAAHLVPPLALGRRSRAGGPDRAMLQTYLKLGASGCRRWRRPSSARSRSPGLRDEVTHVVTRFSARPFRVHQMVDALQRQGAKTRGRAALAQEIAELARADRAAAERGRRRGALERRRADVAARGAARDAAAAERHLRARAIGARRVGARGRRSGEGRAPEPADAPAGRRWRRRRRCRRTTGRAPTSGRVRRGGRRRALRPPA